MACPPHRNLTFPHSDGKASSLPATAHGLIWPLHARTVTERKYPGLCALSGGAKSRLACGMGLVALSILWQWMSRRACHSAHVPFVSGYLFIQLSKYKRGKSILYLLGRKKAFCGLSLPAILQKNIPQLFELRDTFLYRTSYSISGERFRNKSQS